MELYEYWIILQKKRRVFLSTLFLFVVLALSWQVTQGARYGATLLLNISRSGSQQTNDYTYDGFYRLQADERFADTVVRWIGSPRGAEDILHDASMETKSYGINNLARFFTVGRLSSQVIRVEYTSTTEESAKKISVAVTKILNQYAEELNKDAHDPSWFTITGNEPVIRDARVSLWKELAVSVALGVF
ncbi:MAG: hypothetical protein WBO66_04610, partial [Candidatus Moraniibacteriota bacterium]